MVKGEELGELIRKLRREGRSTREIREILGVGNSTLSKHLKDVPPPEWTKRPRAKDELREEARKLRGQGESIPRIAAALGVSKSSVSLWIRDLPRPQACIDGQEANRQAFADRSLSLKLATEAKRRHIKKLAAAHIPNVTDWELFLVGIALYWAEGSKDKWPIRRAEQVSLINSDANVIQLFLGWLELLGVGRDDLVFRVNIHESADVEAATKFWSEVVGVDSSLFRRPTLKRHNPTTIRKNTGENYHGCLVVSVRRSTHLYRYIAGWWEGLVLGRRGPSAPGT